MDPRDHSPQAAPHSSRPNPLHLAAGFTLVSWSRLLQQIGLRAPADGWRRGVGVSLKNETARFVLSAFNLNVLSEAPDQQRTTDEVEQIIARRLAEFLQAESEFHLFIQHGADEHRVVRSHGPNYSLAFQPWIDGPGRFVRPETWAGDRGSPPIANALPLFEFVCRIGPDHAADLWVRINHVGTDGVPAQEMLTRLEKAWGVTGPIIVPSVEQFAPLTAPRPSPGRAGTVEVQAFIDFSRLLAWRKRENEKLPEPMTFSAAMMWWLARHKVFAPLYVGTTVEVPLVNGIPRGVGVVVFRPADYFGRPDGLAQYVKKFNHEMDLTRRRVSSGCKTLDAAAYLPPRLEATLLRYALEQGTHAFGSMGLSIVKDAKVFGSPLGDAGHADGFIAVGGVSLESTDGKRVGCVVVKGPAERISNYAAVLREVFEMIVPE